jgi:hypothetical protein
MREWQRADKAFDRAEQEYRERIFLGGPSRQPTRRCAICGPAAAHTAPVTAPRCRARTYASLRKYRSG